MEPQPNGNYWQEDGDQFQSDLPAPEASTSPPENTDSPAIIWQASEYIDHQRDGSWFAGLIAVAIIFIFIDLFFIKGYFFSVLVVVMTIALIIFSRRPSRIINYELSDEGIMIGQRFRSFEEFRGFGIIQDGALYCIRLLPAARFGQEVMVYFPPEQGEEIVDTLGSYLPMEDVHLDPIDRLLRRLRL